MYSPMDYLIAKAAVKQAAEDWLAYEEVSAQPKATFWQRAMGLWKGREQTASAAPEPAACAPETSTVAAPAR